MMDTKPRVARWGRATLNQMAPLAINGREIALAR